MFFPLITMTTKYLGGLIAVQAATAATTVGVPAGREVVFQIERQQQRLGMNGEMEKVEAEAAAEAVVGRPLTEDEREKAHESAGTAWSEMDITEEMLPPQLHCYVGRWRLPQRMMADLDMDVRIQMFKMKLGREAHALLHAAQASGIPYETLLENTLPRQWAFNWRAARIISDRALADKNLNNRFGG